MHIIAWASWRASCAKSLREHKWPGLVRAHRPGHLVFWKTYARGTSANRFNPDGTSSGDSFC